MARNASTFCMSTVLITLFDFLYLQLNNNQLYYKKKVKILQYNILKQKKVMFTLLERTFM